VGVTINQVTGTTSSAAFLTHVPPGATVIMATQDNAADLAWGFGSTVTYGTGAIIPPQTHITLTNPKTSPQFDIWVISNTGGHQISATVITSL
jgi:hypothetical protein